MRRWLGLALVCSLLGCGAGQDTADAAAPAAAPALPAAAAASDDAYAGSYADAWGPALGSPLPTLAHKDETGARRDLASLAGRNGLLILINRSADW